MRSVILPLGILLATVAPVSGKARGGGKSTSHKSGSSSGGGTHVTVISTGGGGTVCYNENNQIIRCPPNSARKNLIIGAVVGGIFGSILLGILVYFVIMRCKDKRREREKKPFLPNMVFGKQEYKPLHDESNDL
ncbi:hypothetical protein B0H12DRAFT_1144886 [Mycena haematopus]|nr:hypothetical protein B0H12DRAFT_1144886 [Mycena haematopus]